MQPNIVSLRGDGNGGRTDASCINPVRFRIVFFEIVPNNREGIKEEDCGGKRGEEEGILSHSKLGLYPHRWQESTSTDG